jgi:hypothetical protein
MSNVGCGEGNVKASSFFLHGVCLLVDISGFTALSEAFCDAGKKGIDALQVCTNGYIGDLVNVVHSHGGDIIKFAGDALICVFTNPAEINFTDTGMSISNQTVSVDVMIRAVQCAEEIRQVRTDRLTVHVGMSCGEICFGILGSVENRWECLISGPCIHELSTCLDDAPSMQAVMTAACAKVLFAPAPVETSDDPIEIPVFLPAIHSVTVQTVFSVSNVGLQRTSSGNYLLRAVSGSPKVIGMREQSLPRNAPRKATIDALIRQFVPVPIVEELDSATGLSYFA